MKPAPYGLLSDIHAHAWSAFSTKLPNGRNSRLQIIVDELLRAAHEVKAAGGDTLVIAGDIFHTRGSIDPEVFNPISDAFDEILKLGMKIVALAGNHDLKSNESTELGNAFQSFGKRDGIKVVTRPEIVEFGGHSLLMVPWIPKLDALKAELESWPGRRDFGLRSHAQSDLIMHAGIDGVLSGMPAHGLTPSYLVELGFKRVFSGHYHHACGFESGKVWSIGATTHQTASDIGTKAGFMIVGGDADDINWRASRAPSFVEITEETDPDDYENIVDGNYVRVRGFVFTDAEEKAFREGLEGMSAAGVVMNTERATTVTRTGTTVSVKARTLEISVADHIERKGSVHKEAIKARAANIISLVRSSAE
ncbi:metallophosphoesterase [Methylorubrum extorquens]|uniref:metallophosphoesterase n=1 Tax=Methylorubrum extorquens TaxID=408 RepID=UPI00209EB515|nr:metallophosphoesterase [Methylorubrum extorquens]MCP1540000.1 DNA repair exonuclease SbcCD nuclease subunit [Methylorubrum extorquens]